MPMAHLTTIDNSRQAAYGYDQRVEAFGSLGMAASDNNTHRFNSVVATDQGYRQPPLEHFFLEALCAELPGPVGVLCRHGRARRTEPGLGC